MADGEGKVYFVGMAVIILTMVIMFFGVGYAIFQLHDFGLASFLILCICAVFGYFREKSDG